MTEERKITSELSDKENEEQGRNVNYPFVPLHEVYKYLT